MRIAVLCSLPLIAFTGAISLAQAADEEPALRGQEIYVERCGSCHLEGGFGTRVLERRVPEGQAELEKRDLLPSSFTMTVVRRGLGSMPQIRAAELSDADLQAIAAYLENGS